MGRPLHVDELTGAWEISRWLGVDRKTVYRARFNGMPDPVAIYGEAGGIAVWAWPDIAVWAAAKDYNVEARPTPVGRLIDLDDLASTWELADRLHLHGKTHIHTLAERDPYFPEPAARVGRDGRYALYLIDEVLRWAWDDYRLYLDRPVGR